MKNRMTCKWLLRALFTSGDPVAGRLSGSERPELALAPDLERANYPGLPRDPVVEAELARLAGALCLVRVCLGLGSRRVS